MTQGRPSRAHVKLNKSQSRFKALGLGESPLLKKQTAGDAEILNML